MEIGHYKIVSFDPSLSRTGICLYENYDFKCLSWSRNGRSTDAVLNDTYQAVLKLVDAKKPHFAIKEGYAYNAFTTNITQLAELGGIIKLALFQKGIPLINIVNTTWKSLALSDGHIKKKLIMEAASRLYPVVWHNSDEVDAFLMLKSILIVSNINKTGPEKKSIQNIRDNLTNIITEITNV